MSPPTRLPRPVSPSSPASRDSQVKTAAWQIIGRIHRYADVMVMDLTRGMLGQPGDERLRLAVVRLTGYVSIDECDGDREVDLMAAPESHHLHVLPNHGMRGDRRR